MHDIAISPDFIQQTLNFDVTDFVQRLSSEADAIVGFGVRATDIGAQTLSRGFAGTGPKLIITTGEILPPGQTVPESPIAATTVLVGLYEPELQRLWSDGQEITFDSHT